MTEYQEEVNRISGNVTAALAAIAEKGVTVPDGSGSDALAALIAAIEAGGGGDGGVTYATGTFKPSNSTTYMDITHGLGAIPKIVLFVYDGTSTVKGSFLYGLHADGKSGAIWVTTAQVTVYGRRNNTWDITSSGSTAMSYLQSSLVASDATAETMRIGDVGGAAYNSNMIGFIAGSTYKWLAVA